MEFIQIKWIYLCIQKRRWASRPTADEKVCAYAARSFFSCLGNSSFLLLAANSLLPAPATRPWDASDLPGTDSFEKHHSLGADRARGDDDGGCAAKPQREGSTLIRRRKLRDTLAAGEVGDRTQSRAKLRFNRKSEGRKKSKMKVTGGVGNT